MTVTTGRHLRRRISALTTKGLDSGVRRNDEFKIAVRWFASLFDIGYCPDLV